VKKFGWTYRPNPVGTRCSASVLGLVSQTRSSASLPLNFFSFRGGALATGWGPTQTPCRTMRGVPLAKGNKVFLPLASVQGGDEEGVFIFQALAANSAALPCEGGQIGNWHFHRTWRRHRRPEELL